MKRNTHKAHTITLAIIILTTFLMLSCNLLNQAGQPTEQAETETPTPAPDDYNLVITLRVLEGDDMEEKFIFTYMVDLTKPAEGNTLIIGESSGQFSGKYYYNKGFSCAGSSMINGTFNLVISAQSGQRALSSLEAEVSDAINAAAADASGVISNGQISMFSFVFSDLLVEYNDKPINSCLFPPQVDQTAMNAKLFPMIWLTQPDSTEMYRSIPAAAVDFCFEPILTTKPDDPNYSSSNFRTYYEVCYKLNKK